MMAIPRILTAVALCAAAANVQGAPAPKPTAKPADKPAPAAVAQSAPTALTEDEKTLYAIGLSIKRSLEIFTLTPAEGAMVVRGLNEALAGQAAPDVPLETYGPKINELAQKRRQVRSEAEKVRSTDFLAKAALEPGAVKTASGVIYKELTAGTGDSPKPTDTIKAHYRGTLVDGTEFDSSYKRGEPAQFPLNGVIPCWTEGVPKMKVGGKGRLICPASLAYGDNGTATIPGGAALVFEIELLAIQPPPPPAAAAAPAAPATTTPPPPKP